MENFEYGDHWADIEGDGDIAILTWGSLTGPAREALSRLASEGITVKLIAMRLIAPFQKEALLKALSGCRRTLIVEQTHSAQFYHYLRAQCDLPGELKPFYRAGPKLIGPEEICAQIRDWKNS